MIVSLYAWVSGRKPHWQGASTNKVVFTPIIQVLYLPINKLTPKYNLIQKVTSYSFIYINSKSYDGKLILLVKEPI